MPEAHVLYGITGVVVLGLVAWVVVVLRVAKEPWARPPAAEPSGGTEPRTSAPVDADATTSASPIVAGTEATGGDAQD